MTANPMPMHYEFAAAHRMPVGWATLGAAMVLHPCWPSCLDLSRGGSLQELVEGDRQVSDADAGGVVAGVGDRSSGADHAELADALGPRRVDVAVLLVQPVHLDRADVGVGAMWYSSKSWLATRPNRLSEGGLGPTLKVLARRAAIPVEIDLKIETRLLPPVEVAPNTSSPKRSPTPPSTPRLGCPRQRPTARWPAAPVGPRRRRRRCRSGARHWARRAHRPRPGARRDDHRPQPRGRGHNAAGRPLPIAPA